MIILIAQLALSQSVCMSIIISCECLHEHFMSIVDVKKSQSSQPQSLPMEECIADSLTVHKTVAHNQLQSLESPVFIIVLKASLDGEPVALCCM